MAEGFLRALFGDRFDAYSAGTVPTAVDPRAVSAMAEVGIDISHHRAKSVSEFLGMEIDFVATLCDSAQQNCPFFPGAGEYLHHGFVDPASKSESEGAMTTFRTVRDDIKDWIIQVFGQQEPGVGKKGLRLIP